MASNARDTRRGIVGPPPGAPSQNGRANGTGTGNGHAATRNGDAAEVDVEAAKCHFAVAPPRHFLYPAILLLIAEEARHGYRLVDALLRFGFGPVDRPSIYRALSDLAHDGLVVSWEAESTAGSNRHMYTLTDAGRAQLTTWMAVITLERDGLDRVLDRFTMWTDEQPDR